MKVEESRKGDDNVKKNMKIDSGMNCTGHS